MRHLITVVEDVFQIEGRGTVITGLQQPRTARMRKGAPVVLETPPNTTIATSIAEVEIFRGPIPDGRPQIVGFLLADRFKSEQIPKGTKVFDMSEDSGG